MTATMNFDIDVYDPSKDSDDAPPANLNLRRILREFSRRINSCVGVAMILSIAISVGFVAIRSSIRSEEVSTFQSDNKILRNSNETIKVADTMKKFEKGKNDKGDIEGWLENQKSSGIDSELKPHNTAWHHPNLPQTNNSEGHPAGSVSPDKVLNKVNHDKSGVDNKGGNPIHTSPPTRAPTLPPTSAPTLPPKPANVEEVEKWLKAKVSLDDGPMFEVVERLHHDPKAFTEGLTFANGVLYESNGLKGKSDIRTLDPSTGELLESHPIANKFFGEGLTYFDDKLVQLTWKSKTGFIYDAKDLNKKPETFSFATTRNQGWGTTYDPIKKEIIVGDGSNYLHFWNPKNMKQLRTIQVYRQSGQRAKNINELEFWRGRVLANVWYEDTILVIHPETGKVEKEYDFSTLYPSQSRYYEGADVLNGISVTDDPDLIYVTGKNWDRMFKVKLLY